MALKKRKADVSIETIHRVGSKSVSGIVVARCSTVDRRITLSKDVWSIQEIVHRKSETIICCYERGKQTTQLSLNRGGMLR